MTDSRDFHLGDLLSVTDGKLVSPRSIHGVYDLINYVTGEKHMTHQLSRAATVVKAWLLEQHSWLADVEVPSGLHSEEKVLTWLVGATERWGANHEVTPMPFGIYLGREPVAELREMNPHAKVIEIHGEPESH